MILPNRQAWLEERKKAICGSDAAAILGLNPYMTNVELWENKTGKKEQKDISEKSYVQYGIQAERPMRELFALDYPKFDVAYHEFDLKEHKQYSFIRATLDGELFDRETLRIGVYEGKTTELLNSYRKESWKDRVPDNYFCQLIHNIMTFDADFGYLNARLKSEFQGEISIQEKRYYIDRKEVDNDIDYLLGKEVEYWNKYVIPDIKPSLILPPI